MPAALAPRGDATAKTNPRPPALGRRLRSAFLYTRAIVWEFRWTLFIFLCADLLGAMVLWNAPVDDGLRTPTLDRALYGAWMAMLAQPFFSPGPWYVGIVNGVLPLFGFVVVGEGIVRFGLLMVSRRRGEKEWMNVMASTYRDHVILCGLGHLGHRIFEQLNSAGVEVVVLESNKNGQFVADAKATGAAILIRDMTEDQSLVDAGIEHARTIIIATNRDMANIEVALDARRMNPKIRVLMRLFDQRIAEKIAGAIDVDAAFSASALAAPIVAAMSLEAKVLSTVMINGEAHMMSELTISPQSSLAQKSVEEIERDYGARVLARTASRASAAEAPPAGAARIDAGDTLIIYAAASKLANLAAASCAVV